MFRIATKNRTVRGQVHTYTVIEHPGAVTIVPERGGRFALIRQFRTAIDKEILEFPAGTLEPPETPLNCARRELAEEMGLASDEWHQLGQFFLAPGYSSEFMHIFLARGVYATREGTAFDPGEEISPAGWFTLAELQAAIRQGVILDAKTIAAVGYLTWRAGELGLEP
ncbi:MAG: NUDIX hydrolase [Limnochordales bacterium]|nr:NUDIX hydrolase [Limnochordales bacterium]